MPACVSLSTRKLGSHKLAHLDTLLPAVAADIALLSEIKHCQQEFKTRIKAKLKMSCVQEMRVTRSFISGIIRLNLSEPHGYDSAPVFSRDFLG